MTTPHIIDIDDPKGMEELKSLNKNLDKSDDFEVHRRDDKGNTNKTSMNDLMDKVKMEQIAADVSSQIKEMDEVQRMEWVTGRKQLANQE